MVGDTTNRGSNDRAPLASVLGSVPALAGESIDLDREIEDAIAEEMARKFPSERPISMETSLACQPTTG